MYHATTVCNNHVLASFVLPHSLKLLAGLKRAHASDVEELRYSVPRLLLLRDHCVISPFGENNVLPFCKQGQQQGFSSSVAYLVLGSSRLLLPSMIENRRAQHFYNSHVVECSPSRVRRTKNCKQIPPTPTNTTDSCLSADRQAYQSPPITHYRL